MCPLFLFLSLSLPPSLSLSLSVSDESEEQDRLNKSTSEVNACHPPFCVVFESLSSRHWDGTRCASCICVSGSARKESNKFFRKVPGFRPGLVERICTCVLPARAPCRAAPIRDVSSPDTGLGGLALLGIMHFKRSLHFRKFRVRIFRVRRFLSSFFSASKLR